MRLLVEVSKDFFALSSPENFQRRDPLLPATLRFWGWPWNYLSSIDSPSLTIMVGIVRFADFLEVIFLEEVMVDKW